MTRRWKTAVAIAAAMMTGSVLAGGVAAVPQDAAPQAEAGRGTLVTKTLTTPAGTRSYQVYTPRRLAKNRPLIAWVHGTSKIPNGDRMGLRRSDSLIVEADRLGFSVVAPIQSLRVDSAGMWHFYEPAGLVRGEASILAEILRTATRDQRADPARVYAIGHSAGGGMVHVLGAVYSDLLAATAVAAGFPFVGDPTGVATRTARGGSSLPVFLIHGDRDEVAIPLVGAAELSAGLAANGIGGAASHVREVPASKTDRYRTRISRYGSGRTEVVRAEVLGADHRTGPGGLSLNGPDLDRRVVAFLLSQRRG